MRYIRTKDGKLFDLKKIKDEIKNDEVYNVFYYDYRFKKPRPFDSFDCCGSRGLILEYTYKGKCNVAFIKENKTYNDSVFLECDPEGYRESDDITELCDRFVLMDKEDEGPLEDELIGKRYNEVLNEFKFRIRLGCDPRKMNLYGAVWTDKGLSYVAELEQNGKWKVL